MTEAQFLQWTALVADALLLTARDGRVLAASNGVKALGYPPRDLVGKTLDEFTNTSPEVISEFLRISSRTAQPVLGAMDLRSQDGSILACRWKGMRAPAVAHPGAVRLLLKVEPKANAIQQYTLVNEKIAELNREMQRRKALEAELIARNEYLHVTLHSIGDGVIVTDAEGKITRLNPVAEKLTGWTTEDAAGKPLETVFRIVNEDSRATVENPAIRALREGTIVDLANHTILISKDGAEFPIDDCAAPIRNSAGNTMGAILIFRDVADRRAAEAVMVEQKNLLQTLIANTSSMLFMTDKADRITVVNRVAEEATGYSAGELLNQNLHELLCPSAPCEKRSSLEGFVPSDLPRDRRTLRQRELYFRRKDGSSFPVRYSSSPLIHKGLPSGAVVEAQDITEERARESAWDDSEALFSQLADAIPQLVWAAHPDGFIYWYNSRWYEYTGTTFEQVQGWGWQRVHDPDILPRVLHEWHAAIHEGRVFSMVFPLRGADGNFRPFLTRMIPVRDSAGKIIRWFGSNTDISEQTAMEEELRRTAAKLLDADSRKDEFLATLAHELRNPLAPISTGLELMKLMQDEPGQMEEIRAMLERQTLQLVVLVDDLLEVSRVTRGKFELRRRLVTLDDVVQSAVEASRPIIDQKGHRLQLAMPEQTVCLNADPHRLAQVLSNLLNNAAKYTPQRGNIVLTGESRGPDLLLSVKDDGIGIPPEMRESIFEMFVQVEEPERRFRSGLGIGLTLVRSLVEMHGGAVEVHSSGIGHGSEFRVHLPIVVDSPQEEEAPPPIVEHALTSSLKVLIVDDNREAVETLGIMVDRLGHEVRRANDGQSAIDIAATFLPNVILMDVGMPRLDGCEAARRIREEPWGKSITLVALTGWGQDEDRRRTHEAGFDHHLVKPVASTILLHLFAQEMRKPRNT